jgi:hypothetical protein
MGLPGIFEDRVYAFPKPCRGLARPLLLTRILGGP